MTRLARERDTHLTGREIAVEALRQFDEGTATPSIRQLASALRVSPSAIYHHADSRAAIVQAAVNLVWEEATAELSAQIPNPFADDVDPVDVLIEAGIAARHAFGRHFRIAPYMAATPEPSQFFDDTVTLMTHIFDRLGMTADEAAAAFHAYASFTLGAVLFAASRRIANEQLGSDAAPSHQRRFRSEVRSMPSKDTLDETRHKDTLDETRHKDTLDETRRSLDRVMDMSSADPQRDEALFALGLQRLIDSITPANPDAHRP